MSGGSWSCSCGQLNSPASGRCFRCKVLKPATSPATQRALAGGFCGLCGRAHAPDARDDDAERWAFFRAHAGRLVFQIALDAQPVKTVEAMSLQDCLPAVDPASVDAAIDRLRAEVKS